MGLSSAYEAHRLSSVTARRPRGCLTPHPATNRPAQPEVPTQST